MCTITIIPMPKGGYRLARNRDEQRNQPVATRSQIHSCKGLQVIHPTDPVNDGTWIAVNEAGLTLSVMGVYHDETTVEKAAKLHFHDVITHLLHTGSAEEAVRLAKKDLRFTKYAPFQLIAVDTGGVRSLVWDGVERDMPVTKHTINRSPIFTCSTLGDSVVREARENLFGAMLRKSPNPQKQDSFHSHQWPSQPGISVCMERDDARTVSYTIVNVLSDSIAMLYHDGMPNRNAPESELVLPRVTDAVA
jgi:hypothetical protein